MHHVLHVFFVTYGAERARAGGRFLRLNARQAFSKTFGVTVANIVLGVPVKSFPFLSSSFPGPYMQLCMKTFEPKMLKFFLKVQGPCSFPARSLQGPCKVPARFLQGPCKVPATESIKVPAGSLQGPCKVPAEPLQVLGCHCNLYKTVWIESLVLFDAQELSNNSQTNLK